MNIAALYSGGKDSTMALDWALKQGHKAVCLITLKSKRDDSYMFHIPNIELVKVQAEALEIPLIFEESSGIKEKELEDLERAIKIAIKKFKIEGLVAGALASQYQLERVEKIADDLNLKAFAPYWHYDMEEYITLIIKEGYDARITGIAADGLNEKWLGRKIDEKFLEDIKKLHDKYKVHIGLEGGEGETIVLDGPIFKKRLEIISAQNVMENVCTGHHVIKEVKLWDK